ncbi:hypothetical protein [Aquimarina muelleri]|uniref:Uncharacterized protein n=1 Tax=Aquimarina muelleri TaxID=279356 RepID=A0A918N3A5_9FLAO|nr:hypothetical protein [Aquimarina muelleri]MCX2762228.1 hypothetical protein [Aquimarina muelleri]GGX18243.1 hypothetical protein GCM10007384_19660 [Aquimarina muelleri]
MKTIVNYLGLAIMLLLIVTSSELQRIENFDSSSSNIIEVNLSKDFGSTNNVNLQPIGSNEFIQYSWSEDYEVLGKPISLSGLNLVLNELTDFNDFVTNAPLYITVSSSMKKVDIKYLFKNSLSTEAFFI